MNYELPTETFNSTEAAANRIKRANQFRDLIVQQYKAGYEAMWQTPRTHGDNALSMADMQSVLNQAQATFAAVLTDSAAFVAFIATTYPEALAAGTDDEGNETEPLFPSRYESAPYVYTLDGNGITLVSLKPEWEAPIEDNQ